jgi:CheY-like chemotaxis protein
MNEPDFVAPPAPDWSQTSLGLPETWPPCLRLTVDIMLNSPSAMLLMWGPQRLMVYNDGYAALVGGAGLHPPGASVPTVLPPAWSWSSVALQRAWDGHSASYRNQRLPVWQRGQPGQLPLDLYYTPVRDAQDAVAGILCTLAPAAADAGPDATTRPLRILVVEDNPDAQYLVCETLRALGHAVQAVASGEAALPELAAQHFDVLFTDVSLPGMTGVALARAARRSQPALELLFATGYGDELTRHLEFPARSLQKPYEIEQLQQALDEIGQRLQAGAP